MVKLCRFINLRSKKEAFNLDKIKGLVTHKIVSASQYINTFIKWLLIASATGIAGGLIGTLFSVCIKYANEVNGSLWYLTFLLPLGGVVIVALYRLCKIENDPGTNCVIDSVRNKSHVPYAMAPLIFISSVITHLFGGSAGREGAALQLGGSLGTAVGKILRLGESDMHIALMCGMSGLFSSLFCTPVTAAFFALQVISVGVAYYSALVPCLTSAVISYFVSIKLGASPFRFDISKAVPDFDIISLAQVTGLAAACAVISIIFCVAMKQTQKWSKKLIKNEYLRIIAGGAVIIALTFAVGCKDYNGAGSQIIANAMAGNAKPEAFALKIVFTAVTIGCGYKGGEIVPTLFIGSTFGCVFGSLLGLDPSFGAAVGLICLFCGVINCPAAAILLSVEVFGAEGIIFFGAASAVSYMLSGYYGLYSSQKILYSKLKAEYININAK